MLFKTLGDKSAPAVLFFHAMGVTGESSEPVAAELADRFFCIMPTSTVYCAGQTYAGKADEVRQIKEFLRGQGVERVEMVVASSIGSDLAMAFLTRTRLPVGHVFFDGGQFAQIGTATRRIMVPMLYLAIKSLYWSKGATLSKIMWCSDEAIKPYFVAAGKALTVISAARWRTVWRTSPSRRCRRSCKSAATLNSAVLRITSSTAPPSCNPIPLAISPCLRDITTCSIRYVTQRASPPC